MSDAPHLVVAIARGGAIGLGISPPRRIRSRRASGSGTGIAEISARV